MLNWDDVFTFGLVFSDKNADPIGSQLKPQSFDELLKKLEEVQTAFQENESSPWLQPVASQFLVIARFRDPTEFSEGLMNASGDIELRTHTGVNWGGRTLVERVNHRWQIWIECPNLKKAGEIREQLDTCLTHVLTYTVPVNKKKRARSKK